MGKSKDKSKNDKNNNKNPQLEPKVEMKEPQAVHGKGEPTPNKMNDIVMYRYQGYGNISEPTYRVTGWSYPPQDDGVVECYCGVGQAQPADSGAGQTPTSCQLNLTIVNRGEFDLNEPTTRPTAFADVSCFDRFRQYMDVMKQNYQQELAFLQQQNAMCIQQLLQMVQQRQMGMPQQQCWNPQYGLRFPPYNPPTSYCKNNYQPEYRYTPQGYAQPPPASDNVLYEDVLNGTRITISDPSSSRNVQNISTVPLGNELLSPTIQLNITKSHANEPPKSNKQTRREAFNREENRQPRDEDTFSSEDEPVPQVNLFITIAPSGTPEVEASKSKDKMKKNKK